MLVVCWSPKGGSGTSVVSAGLAIACAKRAASASTIVVDLDGDIPAIFGTPEPAVGLSEWICQPATHAFDDLLVDIAPGLQILPRGSAPVPDAQSNAWSRLGIELSSRSALGSAIIVDGARGLVPQAWAQQITHSVLVVRPCYLALRRARHSICPFDAVIAISEPHRVLTTSDIESVLGVAVSAEIPITNDIARRVDAGVIFTRTPSRLMEALSPLVALWSET